MRRVPAQTINYQTWPRQQETHTKQKGQELRFDMLEDTPLAFLKFAVEAETRLKSRLVRNLDPNGRTDQGRGKEQENHFD